MGGSRNFVEIALCRGRMWDRMCEVGEDRLNGVDIGFAGEGVEGGVYFIDVVLIPKLPTFLGEPFDRRGGAGGERVSLSVHLITSPL